MKELTIYVDTDAEGTLSVGVKSDDEFSIGEVGMMGAVMLKPIPASEQLMVLEHIRRLLAEDSGMVVVKPQ